MSAVSNFFIRPQHILFSTGPGNPVGNMSNYRGVSDCRSRGHEFDPGMVPHFREVKREIISMISFSSLPLIHSRRVVVSYKRKRVHEVLVNHLFKLTKEKCVVR